MLAWLQMTAFGLPVEPEVRRSLAVWVDVATLALTEEPCRSSDSRVWPGCGLRLVMTGTDDRVGSRESASFAAAMTA
jgi:hypothetical protein